jgi:Flp pilus assembly protein TadD
MRLIRVMALAVVTLGLGGCGMFREAEAPKPLVTLRVADAALASGAPEIALRVAEIVLDKEPSNVAAMVAKGDALYAIGAIDQARDTYRAAVAADVSNVGAQIGFGRTLVHANPSAAEAHFLAALAKQPDNVVALNNLGIARDLQDRHAQAQQAYRQALALSPNMPDVTTNLGLSLALSGQGAQAVQVLQPVATAPGASPMMRADLAVAMARGDVGPAGMVHEQEVRATTTYSDDTPITVTPAPIVLVDSRPLPPQPAEPVVKSVAIVMPVQRPAPAAVEAVIKPPDEIVALAAPRPTNPTATGSDTGIYVQMASLDSEQAAHSEWQHLLAHWPDLFGSLKPAVFQAEVHNRTFWRLRTGGFPSVGDAIDFCSRLHAAGANCWTVEPAPRG